MLKIYNVHRKGTIIDKISVPDTQKVVNPINIKYTSNTSTVCNTKTITSSNYPAKIRSSYRTHVCHVSHVLKGVVISTNQCQ
jgi:hypothetical protein